ncbi:hypothetical protein BBK82_03645 [Lentzea guizhouensis]|uniref:Uncharacterized protein n=1 Tax=Lentzea guizhouensis TaxID=1586287 RepID=A0A1B2HC60_9PSEU|nr:hypothetical protein [Lentzea guizhouensis]ANZ35310.1 hypothetical protein BBK82_03645 [Lentzea guizhouensis]
MTAATDLAALFAALAEHLNAHPDLPGVNVSRSAPGYLLQISSSALRCEPINASALLLWHDTLTDPVLTAFHWGRSKDCPRGAKVEVVGKTLNGTEVRVWEVVPELGRILGFTKKGADRWAEAEFSVDILRELAAAENGEQS